MKNKETEYNKQQFHPCLLEHKTMKTSKSMSKIDANFNHKSLNI